jgi:hypothetical protein
MDLFAQAACLNNQGVAALLEGNDKAAVAALTQSIKMMKQEMSSRPSNSDSKKSTTLSDDCEHSTAELPGFQGAQESYLFTEAIIIPETGNQSVVNTQIYSAVVVFNLALAVHREGKNGKIESSMAKAQKLYTLASKVLNKNQCMNRVAVIVKLASINNLSQIRFDCGEYELARKGLHHLSAFMRASGNTNNAMLEEPGIQCLFMNVLLLKAPVIAPAA